MEGYTHSHSRPHSRAQASSGPVTFSANNKKPPLNNGGGFFATSYDDVFGGPPKYSAAALAPRAEDYSEIFGAFRSSSSSRASSIPVLDLPAVADIDSAASLFDYSEVFGGFKAVDLAVSYDELFRPFDCGECGGSDDDDEAWTPVGTESLSDDSDPFAFSEKSQCFSNGNSDEPLDNKQFNVSYHKVNIGTSTCMPNRTHVAQLNAVPGYTCVVDETKSLREVGTERFCSATVDEIVYSMDSSCTMSQKRTRRTMSEMSHDDAGIKTFDGERRCGRAPAASMSHVNSTSASDINLSAEPSHLPPPTRPPPVPAERSEDLSRLPSGLKASNNCDLGATVDDRLPPCFDMEVDASSSAAASAAAMKDAMEKAQAKLKAAKVLMERKKDGLQNSVKLGSKTDVTGWENVKIINDKYLSGDDRVQATSDRRPAKEKSSGKDRHVTMASKILPDISVVEQPLVVNGKPSEKKHGKKCSLSMDTAFSGGAGEWKEATQYYEFVNNDNTILSPPLQSKGDMKTSVIKQRSDDEHNLDSAGEAYVPVENRRRLKATNAVSRQEYYDKMVKVAQEVHDRVTSGHAETDERLTGMPQETHKEQKAKLGYGPEKNVEKIGQAQRAEEERLGEACRKEEAETRIKNAVKKQETKKREAKKKETEACHRQNNDRNTNDSHQCTVEILERKEEVSRMTGSSDRMESGRRVQETVVSKENEKRDCERQSKENKQADAVKQKRDVERREMKDKRSKELLEDGFDVERHKTACESQESGKTKDLKEEVQNTSNGAFENVFGKEIRQEACGSQENGKKNDLLQRDKYGNYVEEAANGRVSEKILQECVELEKRRKLKEAPEQVIRRQRLDESHEFEAEHKKTEDGQSRDKNEKKLEKITEQRTVENMDAIQAAEPEQAFNILENTCDVEDQKVLNRKCTKIESEAEDQGLDRSSEVEIPMEDEHVKPSDGADPQGKDVKPDTLTSQLRKPQIEADGFQDVFARKENGEVRAVHSDEISKLKAVETADEPMDAKPTEFTAPQMGADDNEQGRTVHASDSLDTDRNDNNTKSDEVCTRSEQKLKDETNKVAQLVSDSKLPSQFDLEQGGKRRNLGQGHMPCDEDEKVKPSEGVNGWNEQSRKKDEAHTAMPERKESFQKRSHLPNTSQNTGRKGKIINNHCSLEEKSKEKERELENEQLRKLEEEREREREREKDRMAVEFAIHEARERAYSDARDKAEKAALERATDEARQRAMSEARERLEKACAEARERSSADKALDARLRAERAAVERATVEARQRAVEKAMVERATFEARERMQRSISEKYTSERDVVMRQSSMPSSSKEFEAADVEPAERCKARLERHRRTVDRVAKALAEKNMRDLLAQRERAERSRLAETLDADIKRWSSGKEGNLRALLSTLQYILGADSGWQPIPLTEVITAAAVKKAYRKATLCVHPDKLQQRGASIQQKYICEKVFDLLKEAWNRFNSEEK